MSRLVGDSYMRDHEEVRALVDGAKRHQRMCKVCWTTLETLAYEVKIRDAEIERLERALSVTPREVEEGKGS